MTPVDKISRTPEALLRHALELLPGVWFSAGQYTDAINGNRPGLLAVPRRRVMDMLLTLVRIGEVEIRWQDLARNGHIVRGREYRAIQEKSRRVL